MVKLKGKLDTSQVSQNPLPLKTAKRQLRQHLQLSSAEGKWLNYSQDLEVVLQQLRSASSLQNSWFWTAAACLLLISRRLIRKTYVWEIKRCCCAVYITKSKTRKQSQIHIRLQHATHLETETLQLPVVFKTQLQPGFPTTFACSGSREAVKNQAWP